MTWVRISDDFMDHPKVLDLGADTPVALTLWLAGLGYANRYLTDGRIPAGILARLTSLAPGELRQATDALVSVGLWERSEHGFEIHDYLDYQRSHEWIITHRKQAHDRGVKGAAVRYGIDDSIDHSIDDSIATSKPPNDAPNPNPNPNPTTTPAQAKPNGGGGGEGLDLVEQTYLALYHKAPTEGAWSYLSSLLDRYEVDRVITALRKEHAVDSNPRNLISRMEKGLETGNQLRRIEALQ